MIDNFVNLAFRTAYRLAYPLMQLARLSHAYEHNGVCVAIWYEESVLLVRHSYRRGLLLPGGGIQRTEQPAVSLAREMQEELGIELQPNSLKLIDKRPRVYGSGQVYLYETHLNQKPIITIDHREIVFADFVAIAQVVTDIKDDMQKDYLLTKKASYLNRHISV